MLGLSDGDSERYSMRHCETEVEVNRLVVIRCDGRDEMPGICFRSLSSIRKRVYAILFYSGIFLFEI